MKRVYRQAGTSRTGDGWGIVLDGRPMRTPARNDLSVPSEALAGAIAAEWEAQQDEIRPTTMPLTRLAATAIDRTAKLRRQVIEEVANYAGTDLVCYRADHPPALAARQHAVWQPLINWATVRYDAALSVTCGIIPTRQSPSVLKALGGAVAALDDFRLTALHSLTASCGSLVIALAVLESRLGAEEAFAASQLDESFQIEAWGEDAEAAVRREALAADIAAAARFLALLDAAR